MTAIADVALWLTLLGAAWNTGVGASRWRLPHGPGRVFEAGLFLAAVFALVALGSWAGDLFVGKPLPLLTESVPITVGTGYRLAVLWAVPRGIAVTLATICVVLSALAATHSRTLPAAVAPRQATALSGVAAALLVLVLLDPGGRAPPTAIPAFAQSAAAAIAPLAALGAVALILHAAALGVALRGHRGIPAAASRWRLLVIAAFGLATVALGAEQAARATLGIGPRVPVVLGSASSGLVLWLVTGAMLHRRLRAALLPGVADAEGFTPMGGRRWAGHLAHAGTALVACSFLAHVLASRATLDLPPGVPVTASDAFGRSWRLVNQGVSRFDDEAADVTSLAVEATGPDARARLVTTERREIRATLGGMVEPVARRGSLATPLQQVRILFESADASDVARVRVAFVPLLVLWPAGLLLLAASAIALVLWPAAGRDASFPST